MSETNMTLPNPLVPGWYKTRGGELAEVLTVIHERLTKALSRDTESVLGFIGERHRTWFSDGRWDKYPTYSDLVEFLGIEKPKKKVTKSVERWINIYTHNPMGGLIFETEEEAIRWQSSFDKIATVKLTGSYEVEE